MIDKYSAYWNDPTYGFNAYLSGQGLDGYQMRDSDGTMQLFSPDGNRYGGSQELISGYDPKTQYSQNMWNQGTQVFDDGMQGWEDMAKEFGFSDPRAFVESIQGQGTWGQDKFGNYTFAPSSGRFNAYPEWTSPNEGSDLAGILRIATPFMPVWGAALGAGDFLSQAFGGDLFGSGSGTYEMADSFLGGSGSSSIFGSAGGGDSMFDWLDSFDFGDSMLPNDLYGSIGEQIPNNNLFTGTNFGQAAENSLSQFGSNLSTGIAGGAISPAANSLYSGLSGGGDWWSKVGDFIKNPIIPGTNVTPGNLASGLFNYLIQERQAGRLSDAAMQSAMMSNPLMQPQRFPFQTMANQLMFDPKGYQMSPYAQGATDLARQAFEANVSKFGPGGTQFSDYLKNYQNILSQDYFKLMDANLMAGGYTMQPSAGQYGGLMGQSAQAGANAFEGFGKLFSQTTPQGQTPPLNPFQNIFNQAVNSWTTST